MITIATEQIDALAKAIHDTLWATGVFKSGTPFVRKAVGDRPGFHLHWDGFNMAQDMRTDPGPAPVTHRFQIDIYVSLSGDLQEGQQQLWRVVETTMAALKADHRLGGKCLRSRVNSGTADLFLEGTPMAGSSLILEADCMGF